MCADTDGPSHVARAVILSDCSQPLREVIDLARIEIFTQSEGDNMTVKKRITTGALALALAVGGVLAVPTAANAATWKSSGHTTKTQCLNAEAMAIGVITGGGGVIYSGDGCAYRGASLKWSFAINYR